MLLVALIAACTVESYLLAFYLVMLHRAVSYTTILTTFFAVAFAYQALRYKLRSAYLLKHQETVLILGTGREAQKMWKHIRIQCNRLVVFKGFVGEAATKDAAPDILARTVCTIDSLESYLHSNLIDTLVLTANGPRDLAFAKDSIRIAQECGTRLLCMNEVYEDLPSAPSLHTVCESYVDFDRPSLLVQVSRGIKSLADRTFAGLLLILLTPLALPLLALYRLILGESPLVSESVYGYHRHSFTMWNIRTAATKDRGPFRSSQTHPYSTASLRGMLVWRIGQFLQISGLSHTPRLWNICTGDMSLVGPTPIALTQATFADSKAPLRRYTMRPGLCWPEPQSPGVTQPSQADEEATLSYIQHWSLTLDWATFKHWVKSQTRRTLQALSIALLNTTTPISATTPRAR